MTVVDASVLVSALIDSGRRGVWARSQLRKGPFAAPHLIIAEATHALRGAQLNKRLSSEIANLAFADLLRTPVELYPFHPFAERIWQLRDTLTVYDAWYVALAEALGVPMATLNERLANAPGPTCHFHTPRV